MRRDGRSLEEGQTFFVTRVLVAEDDPINRRIVTRMLERLGCRTDAVSSGPEILATLARTNYNLVLMNVEMPEIDGHHVTAEIRRREPEDAVRLPVVAMTAHAAEQYLERSLAAGMDDYLQKPVTYRDLAAILDRWCSAKRVSAMSANPELSRLRHRATILCVERLQDVSAGDLACEHALLQSLLRDTATSVTRIGAAFAEANATQIAALAHGLWGACETVGALSLANFCRDLETKAKSASLLPADEALARFQHEYERLRDVTVAYLESRAKHAPSLLPKPRV